MTSRNKHEITHHATQPPENMQWASIGSSGMDGTGCQNFWLGHAARMPIGFRFALAHVAAATWLPFLQGFLHLESIKSCAY